MKGLIGATMCTVGLALFGKVMFEAGKIKGHIDDVEIWKMMINTVGEDVKKFNENNKGA